jgi:two-component system phosphate regulon sensor histidine kinase PhoR
MELLLALSLGIAIGLGLRRRHAPREEGQRDLRGAVHGGVQQLQAAGIDRLQPWLDAAPLGWLLLADGALIAAQNPVAERLLQLPTHQLLRGQSLQRLVDAPQLHGAISLARTQQRSQRLVVQLAGSELEVLVLPASDGWTWLWLQDRRSLEAQLDQQERWVSDVAHELRTPITALMLVGERLAREIGGQQAVLVQRYQRELGRLEELVRDLLELSRLENVLPGDSSRHAPVLLAELVETVWNNLRPLADQHGLQLRLQGDRELALLGDEARLHRALLNLLDNAIRYSPDGGTVEVRVLRRDHWCLLSVRDHGSGLSAADQDHLFERFYRGDPSRVRSQHSGSGLGMSIVQQIALTHGGRVQASNHPGGGALMELVLPLGLSSAGAGG